MARELRSRGPVVIATSLIAAFVFGGVASAVQSPISDSGVIYGCYNPSTGAFKLRVISTCPKSGMTVPISWNIPGSPGIDGVDGAPGIDGVGGLQGLPGVAGVAGDAGVDGPSGATGPQGPIGPVGPEGPRGIDGAVGLPGPQGNDGADGPQGPGGAQGTRGMQGWTGLQGPQGQSGLVGTAGSPGSPGATGLAGTDGDPGANGATGPVGLQGSQGVAGPTGPDGADGSPLLMTVELTKLPVGGYTVNDHLPSPSWETMPLTQSTWQQPPGTTQVFRGHISFGSSTPCEDWATQPNGNVPPVLTLKVTIDGETKEISIDGSFGGVVVQEFSIPLALFTQFKVSTHTISAQVKTNCVDVGEIAVEDFVLTALTINI